jgi:hypothetical protein
MTPPVPFGISVRPSLSIFCRKSKWYVKDRLQIFTNGELTSTEKQVFGPFDSANIAQSFLLQRVEWTRLNLDTTAPDPGEFVFNPDVSTQFSQLLNLG